MTDEQKKRKSDYNKQWRADMISAGICSGCGINKSKANRTRCQACLDKSVQRTKKLRIERVSNGHCWKCDKPPLYTKQLCKDCSTTFLSRSRELKEKVLNNYGAVCVCCKETTKQFLSIDHINGGGNKHKKESGIGNGTSFYRWIIKNNFPSNLRILCHNCNLGRQINGGTCPHQTQVSTPRPA